MSHVPASLPIARPPRRHVQRAVVALVTVLVAVCIDGAIPAHATVGATHSVRPVPTDAGQHIAPELEAVKVSGGAYSGAQSRFDTVVAQLAADVTRRDNASKNLVDLGAEVTRLTERIDADTRVKTIADREIARLDTRIRHLALQAYVGASDGHDTLAALDLDLDAILAAKSRRTISGAVMDTSLESKRAQVAISTAAAERLRTNRASRQRANEQIVFNTSEVRESEDAIVRDTALREKRHDELLLTRATATVVGTNLPLVALDAYVKASAIANTRRPNCHMSWSLLAGIGQIESHQGTYGGGGLTALGAVTTPIFGVPLDGTGGNELIATAGGFSRAEGPMQFIPSTWAAFAVDADSDGRADPQNLYDAAGTAAVFLCRIGTSMDDPGGRRSAILTYNNAAWYADEVDASARSYAAAVPDVPLVAATPTP